MKLMPTIPTKAGLIFLSFGAAIGAGLRIVFGLQNRGFGIGYTDNSRGDRDDSIPHDHNN